MLAGTAFVLCWIFGVEEVPVSDFDAARKALNEARISKAEIYSTAYFTRSEDLFDSAMVRWREQNDRFILNRDYGTARNFALESVRYAVLARTESQEGSISLPLELGREIEFLRRQLEAKQELLLRMPLPDQVITRLNEGRLKLSEAESAYCRSDYFLCREKTAEAGTSLRLVFETSSRLLTDYYKDYVQWEKWARNTIQASARSRSPVIIIDKMAKEARVYVRGTSVWSFRVEMGRNWMGDKHYQGDRATPEGYYTVVDKKEHPHTMYFRALLIDYPNSEDTRRFNQEKRAGIIPESSRIGGNIEIHGDGGLGRDWTDGCIALKNTDMEVLYALVNRGTRVTIVGSLKPMEEL
jgi:hypothetical protein